MKTIRPFLAVVAALAVLTVTHSFAAASPPAQPVASLSVEKALLAAPESPSLPAQLFALSPATRWTGAICALALGVAARGWMTRRDRNKLFTERFGVSLRALRFHWQRLRDSLRGRGLAYNTVMTPNECRDGVASLHGTAAIATKNYVVVRGADDQHFKIGSAVTDVPLGILLNDEIATDEVDVIKKSIALFGSYQGTLPGVAEAAIAVDALLTPGVGTFGRVKTLPTTPGIYWVIGKSRTTVDSAGDPVSIVHCVPFQVRVGIGYVTGEGGAVTQATDRSTGVTLSKLTGQITTHNASLAAGAEVSFTVTNTLVAATDVIVLNITPGGTGTPHAYVSTVAAGSFQITLTNLHASTADTSADVINFAVIKGVAA